MKKLLYFIVVLLGACQGQPPDYVTLLSPVQLHDIQQKEDIFLVDVHTPQQQHIRGTDLFAPFNEIEKYRDKLPADKNTPIYLYCEGGPMGNSAAKTLHQLGYRNLFNLDGGAAAWRQAGFEFD